MTSQVTVLVGFRADLYRGHGAVWDVLAAAQRGQQLKPIVRSFLEARRYDLLVHGLYGSSGTVTLDPQVWACGHSVKLDKWWRTELLRPDVRALIDSTARSYLALDPLAAGVAQYA